MLNWDDYRIFLDVARSGSLSAASIILKIDAATVGRSHQQRSSNIFDKIDVNYQLFNVNKGTVEKIK